MPAKPAPRMTTRGRASIVMNEPPAGPLGPRKHHPARRRDRTSPTGDERGAQPWLRTRRRPDAPRAGPRRTGLEADHIRSVPERVGGTCHRLDRDAAPVHVGERIAGEHHQVAIAGVDPERETVAARRFAKLNARTPVVAWLKIRERGVEPRLADRPRVTEVVVRPFDGVLAHGNAAVVRAENRA